MTTIKEHIEQGHYERDSQGWALVPIKTDKPVCVVRIIATTLPCSSWPIVGCYAPDGILQVLRWNENGYEMQHGPHLLPPPPRKVKVTAWALLGDGDQNFGATTDPGAAEEWRRKWPGDVVELTGERERPWS